MFDQQDVMRAAITSPKKPRRIGKAVLTYRPTDEILPGGREMRTVTVEVTVNDRAYAMERILHVDDIRSRLDMIFADMLARLHDLIDGSAS
jgi:hypothetical protein